MGSLTMLDLLMFPGLDNSDELKRMRLESKKRMEAAMLRRRGIASDPDADDGNGEGEDR